ncbi:MAG: hypothetical protein NC211_08505 [Alistipes senegalensis]|nr:hypothetical protein [Oxalobacter formigenes]MCM1281847.1 hypothetical protein [Alistipes senegalensis]
MRQLLQAVCIAAFCCGLSGFAVAGEGEYARLYVINRCYHTVDITVGQEKEPLRLPSVPPRAREMVWFAGAGRMDMADTVVLSRESAPKRQVSLGEFVEGAQHERWKAGKQTVDSWFVTLCPKERNLADPAGMTMRPAYAEEQVAEYEMRFTRVPGSHDPVHFLADYPVRVLLDGVPLHLLATGPDGVLRFLMPAGVSGEVTLESPPEVRRTLWLGKDWAPVRVRAAKAGEAVLVRPVLLSMPQEW